MFLSSADFLSGIPSQSISLVPGHARHFVRLDLDPNCLQLLSAEDTRLSGQTGLRSAVSNVSGNRCEPDCRSRGRELDPSPVPYFRGD